MANWEPSVEDLTQVLTQQNPWLLTGEVPVALAPPTERPLVAGIRHAVLRADLHRFQVILGPRRVGKTTVMYQVARHLLAAGKRPQQLWWLRLDHPLLMDVDLGTLVRATLRIAGGAPRPPSEPVFLFLDELVYADNWDLWLKTFFDDRWPVKIVGSSSAVAALRRQHVESGVGRWEERFLTPYLLSEYLALRGTPVAIESGETLTRSIELVMNAHPPAAVLADARRELLFTGGFPELLVRFREGNVDDEERLVESQRVLRADAVERAIYKDIPQSFGLDRPMQLERLLYVLAGQATGMLSPKTISAQLGITEPTVENYLSYLERSFVLFTLQNYSGSEVGRQRRGRRIYFYDVAIRNAALERGLAPLRSPVEMGVLYENIAAAHLYCLSLLTGIRCFHWRDGDAEVDLIYDSPTDPIALELASSATHPRRGLLRLVDRYPKFRGKAWLVAVDAAPILPEQTENGIGQLPLDYLLTAIGSEFQRRLQAQPSPRERSVSALIPEKAGESD